MDLFPNSFFFLRLHWRRRRSSSCSGVCFNISFSCIVYMLMLIFIYLLFSSFIFIFANKQLLFSWNWWFHGKIFKFRNFRISIIKQVQCFYLLFLPKTTGTAGSSTILSTSQISFEVEVNPSQWALPGGSLNKRTES